MHWETNRAPHLTKDTNGKVTTSQLDITNESQEVSPFPAKRSAFYPYFKCHIPNTKDFVRLVQEDDNMIRAVTCDLQKCDIWQV